MRTENNSGVLTIFLNGRIDSACANQTQTDISAIIAAEHPASLILDAADLAYISSAGLRVVLKLKKDHPDIRIVNVCSDVYEIFDMTGFTEIITVEKALRTLDISGCEIIDKGAYGTVYRINADTIVKVYERVRSIEDIHRERELARKAFIAGVPTAIPYDVVRTTDGKYGAVFELLNAKSFARLIQEGEPVEELARLSADILKIIHRNQTSDPAIPRKKPVATGWAKKSAQYLPQEIGKKLIALFEAIPETDRMLHGDFHIKNILRQNGEDLLIDMDTLSIGHPIYELSAIFSAYEGFDCGGEGCCANFLGITTEQCRSFLDSLFRSYFDGKTEQEIAAVRGMAALISYTRLYRWNIEHYGEDSAEHGAEIAFCKNYLIENIPAFNALYY